MSDEGSLGVLQIHLLVVLPHRVLCRRHRPGSNARGRVRPSSEVRHVATGTAAHVQLGPRYARMPSVAEYASARAAAYPHQPVTLLLGDLR